MTMKIKKMYVKVAIIASFAIIIVIAFFMFKNCRNNNSDLCPLPEIVGVDTESVFQNKIFEQFKITINSNSVKCNGDLQYSIENGREGSWQSNNEFINVVPGTYRIAVKDQNDSIARFNDLIVWEGYQGQNVMPQKAEKAIHAKIESNNETCAKCNDGKIVINAVGGKLPYEYSIDKGKKYSAKNSFTNLAPATYYVFVKDANGKIYTHTIPVIIEKAAKTIDKISKAIVEKSMNDLALKRNYELMDSILTWFESENTTVKGSFKTKQEYSIYRYLSRLVYDGQAGSIKLKIESLNYNDKNRINEITVKEL